MSKLNQKYRIVGVDLDDVLLNFADPLIAYVNGKYGTNHRRKDITTFLADQIWGITPDEANKRITDFYHTDGHKNAPPVAGAITAIRKLVKAHELHVITAKSSETKGYMEAWTKRHFREAFKEIHFTRTSNFDPNPKKKVDICKALGVEVFIEDSMDNAQSIASENIPVFLLDAPWNQGETPALVTRVSSWKMITDAILE